MRPPSGCWKNFARPRASMMGCDIRYYKDAQNAELDRMLKGIGPATDLEYRSHCERVDNSNRGDPATTQQSCRA